MSDPNSTNSGDASANRDSSTDAAATGLQQQQQQQAPQGAPAKYEAFKLPEGAKLEGEELTGFEAFARNLNLTQEQAQQLVDRDHTSRAAAQEALRGQHEGVVQQWKQLTTQDAEIGGEQLNANLAIAAKALDTFGSPELRQYFDATGLGNHPEVVKALVRIGKAISEDGHIGTRGDSKPPADPAKRIYPTMN